MPTVSVIIATHNYGSFLPEALQSVLSQTYSDWECIIVDDASTDNTEVIAREWMEKDSRFQYIKNNRNLGASGTRNAGISSAQGEYIAVLDADDWWEPDKLELQMKAFAENPDALICYAGMIVHVNDNTKISMPTEYTPSEFSYALRLGDQCPHGSVIIKKAALTRVNGYDITLRSAEDWDLLLRILYQFGPEAFIFVKKPLLHYRVHGNNKSGNPYKICKAERIIVKRSIMQKGYSIKHPQKAWLIIDEQFSREINHYKSAGKNNEALRSAIYSALLSPIRRWKWLRAIELRKLS